MPIRSTHTKRQLDEVTCVHPNAASLDIGSAEIVVAVPAERAPPSVPVFRTFSPDLHALVAWRITCDIDTVAIEATVVFWIPIYELLEAAGITPIWSTPAMSKPCLAERPIGMMLTGSRSCTRSAYAKPRFVLMPRSARFARSCAIVPS